ncbi:zinc ABC transporter substrate-binding protein [Terasakiella sp. SH-1]|uniref:zinc ABC transporter substrate-binding protein n=1 Tax=Terasakiella sp. SH-1 TaxID=2560057 RepID=UPI001073F943|nr:zinc ABC transporter substrate-binding protein [Terasakiella sp. SH-1]
MKKTAGALFALSLTTLPLSAQALEVVTSIAPLHSLVSGVMGNTGQSHLIVKGAQSPHNYQLKPSDARKLQNADAIFWIGEEMETFLVHPLKALGQKAAIKAMVPHDEEEHEDHDTHKDHDDHHDDDHHNDHAEHEGHHHGEDDMHIWLDPVNAQKMVHEIEETLSKIDPKNASTYEKNAHELEEKLDHLLHEVEEALHPVHKRPIIVFHDAYSHFEKRFDLNIVAAISISPQKLPGAKRLKEIRHTITHKKAQCVFAEPQFQPKLVQTVIEGTTAKAGVLDPLGAQLEYGTAQYFKLIQNMAQSIKDCIDKSKT